MAKHRGTLANHGVNMSIIKNSTKGKWATPFLEDFQPMSVLWSGSDAPYPSESSARWDMRKLRTSLLDKEAIALFRGRLMVNPERFAHVARAAAIDEAKRIYGQP
jgi:hypothetical protein